MSLPFFTQKWPFLHHNISMLFAGLKKFPFERFPLKNDKEWPNEIFTRETNMYVYEA